MRVIVSAGGTGGHIYPALAIIDKIKELEPDSTFLYIGTHNRMENEIVPAKGIPFESIEVYGFNRKHLLKNIKMITCLFKAKKRCRKLIQEFKPDIVIGVGGYVTVPVLLVAHRLKIKTFLHEQNSVAGKANLMLAKYVDLIGVSMKSAMNEFPHDKTIFTGNPCSEGAIKVKPADKKSLGLTSYKKLVLIVMGSLGASEVNKVVVGMLKKVKDLDYEFLFVTGKGDYDSIIKESFPSNVKVVAYLDPLTAIMKKTDLIVTRAGASTLSEIIALNIPAILIPSPYVPNNHQLKNALDLVHANGAILIEEKDLTSDILLDNIDESINDKTKLHDMSNNLRQLYVKDSATVIYNHIKKLMGDNE